MKLYAQLDNHGTAKPDTTLCAACVEIAAFRAAHGSTTCDCGTSACLAPTLNNTDYRDVTGNQVIQEVGCQSCGWPSRIEWAEFMRRTLDAFPFAQVEEDNDGQLIIYTGLGVETDGNGVQENAVLLP